MEEVIGVDEAGRGPVLGSMFVAAVAVPDEASLPPAVRDSKEVPAAERRHLATAIDDVPSVRSAVIEVPVEEIDDGAGRLNQVTAAAAASAIERVLADAGDDRAAIVDACDTDEQRYADTVAAELSSAVAIVAEHGADERHPSVSAASLLAKEAREAHVEVLRETYGECGSGYPGDPSTRAFLTAYVEENGELPECARRSWKTCADLRAAATQGTLSQF